MNKIAILGQDELAQALAQKYRLPLLSKPSPDFDFYLEYLPEGLSISSRQSKFKPLHLDFNQGKMARRQAELSLRNEALAKAVGLKAAYNPKVLDVTAGLGKDAFILASLGCQIDMIEQNPGVAALLEDAMQRYQNIKPLSWQLFWQNSLAFLENKIKIYDVIYIDPMFPARTKSALVKKDMQLLQQLLEKNSLQDEKLLELSLKCAKERVVVKRPKSADYLAHIKADFAIQTKSYRFDVYLLAR